MAGLYIDEITDPNLLALPKHKVGDLVRIRVKADDMNSSNTELVQAFTAIDGRKLKIKDIILWECGVEGFPPYVVTYEFYMGHLMGRPNRLSYMETVYMTDDEIEPVRRARNNGKVAELG